MSQTIAGTVVKPLKKPWKVGGQEANDIEMRESTVDDLIEAEKEANPATAPNAFNVQVACLTMVRAGTFTGPFVASHFRNVSSRNWYVMREAMQETQELGEG